MRDDTTITELAEPEMQQAISDAVEAISHRRAAIEQTKGMLMMIYDLDADAAFELLRWQSQQHNVKLGALAAQIAQELTEAARARARIRRMDADTVLLTAHERVRDSARHRCPATGHQASVDAAGTGRAGAV